MNISKFSVFTVLVCLVMIPYITLSQDQEVDVIYLKNGTTIVGQIRERIPEKSVVIETREGIEIVDYNDIKNIEREFFPKITSLYPSEGEPGTSVVIAGSFPSQQKSNAKIFFGKTPVRPAQWKAGSITVTVPVDTDPGAYAVTVQVGNQKAVSGTMFTVRMSETGQGLTSRGSSQQQSYDRPYADLGSSFNLSYLNPTGEFKETGGGNSGFAGDGGGFGFEIRSRIAENFYIPFGYSGYLNSIDLEAMKNAGGGFTDVTSEDEMYITVAFHLGLGLLIPFSEDFFLYTSGEGTFGYYYRPDLKFTNSGGSVSYESASAWPFGFSWSAGFLFSNGMTLGYRYYSATPTYTEKYTVSGDYRTYENEREQPTSFGVLFLGIPFGD
ncbi:MAG: IPT/TIG domain-containing protein [Bacteroidota bacterium]